MLDKININKTEEENKVTEDPFPNSIIEGMLHSDIAKKTEKEFNINSSIDFF